MKILKIVTAAGMSTLLVLSHQLLAQAPDAKIAEATVPIPPHLRDDATVYDANDSPPSLLREGTNGIVCFTDVPAPGYEVSCLDESWLPYMRRFAALQAAGVSMLATQQTINAELASGEVASPDVGAIGNLASGPSRDNLEFVTTIFLGDSGAQDIGMPTQENQQTWRNWTYMDAP